VASCPARTGRSKLRDRAGGAALLAIVLLATGCRQMAPAQSWEEMGLRLKPRQPVTVTEFTGVQVSGRVTAVDDGALVLDAKGVSRAFGQGTVQEIRRNGDAPWNGLLIGAAVGVAAAALPDNRCHGTPAVCDDRQVPQRIGLVGLLAGAGAAFDLLHHDRTVIYRARNPVVTLSATPWPIPAGVSVSIRVGWPSNRPDTRTR
jgi:hypothetical protein